MGNKHDIIAIDFDGTVVTHEYPSVGRDAGAVPVLQELVARGYRLVLLTMRDGALLEEAKRWFADRKIPLWAVNANPEQRSWTGSPKVYAHLYIDDSNLGCPLKTLDGAARPVADWSKIRKQLIAEGFLDYDD